MIRKISALVAVLSLAGCLESVEPERVYHWGGVLEEGSLTFESAFVWYETQQIVVAAARVEGDIVPNVDPPVRAWRIYSNSCVNGGAVVGQDLESWYPNLAVDVTGEAQIETSFNAAIEVGGTYHAKLHASPDDDTVVACVNLIESSS